MFSSLYSATSLLLLSLLAQVHAQYIATCQPLNETCPPDAALGTSHHFEFNSSDVLDQGFNTSMGTVGYGDNGAEFTIAKKGDMPTIISKFYIFWGSVSVVMRAAKGQGIISTIVLLSDDLDEVDWEMMGGNATHAETNYFGKGNDTLFDRAVYHPVDTDLRENFHNYTTHWTSDELQWLIDGNLVRTLKYGDALRGANYPQTPMAIRMGVWAGGDSKEPGTVEWAGGATDYSAAPFTMYVQSATVHDFSEGKEYTYGDHSGSWQSIKTVSGNSTIKEELSKSPPLTLAQKWKNLPSTTKIAIYASAGAVGALIFGAMLFTCIRQRRKGRREREAYNAKVEQEREQAYQDQIQLREKGLGGWDSKEFASQGDDALGGWGGAHGATSSGANNERRGSSPLQSPSAVMNPFDTRPNSPAPSRNMTPGSQQRSITPGGRTMTPAQRSMTPGARTMSPAPSLVAPQPQRSWSGAPQSSMNPELTSYGSSRQSPASPASPYFSPQQGQAYGGGFGGGSSRGGYQRF